MNLNNLSIISIGVSGIFGGICLKSQYYIMASIFLLLMVSLQIILTGNIEK